MNHTLGQRNFGEILSETFTIYGNHFLPLAAIAAIAVVGCRILLLVASVAMTVAVIVGGIVIGFALPVVIILLVTIIVVYSMMDGALIYALSEQYVQPPISFGRAYRCAWSRRGPLIGSVLLYFLAVFALAITIIGIPAAIYFAIRWSFIRQAIVVEGCGIKAAFARSSALVRENWWRVLGILLVTGLIGGAITALSGIVPIVGSIIGAIMSVPITVAITTLLYYDLRVRKEGYNLETLAAEVHLPMKNDAVGTGNL